MKSSAAESQRLQEVFDASVSEATRKSVRAQWSIFERWCVFGRETPLPATPDAVCRFAEHRSRNSKAATVASSMFAIAFKHREAGFADPCRSPEVRKAMKGIRRLLSTRQEQASPLSESVLPKLLDRASSRDAALVLVMRDGLLRRSEASALLWEDVEFGEEGDATALIRQSKTDRDGEGKVFWISPKAVAALRKMGTADAGPVFGITPGHVGRIIRKLGRAAGIDLSGHSARVGMAQDLAAAGCSLPELMVAGRWKKPETAVRYIERVTARNGAVAAWHQKNP